MNSCELVAFITSLAIVIADQIENNDDLNLLAVSLTQLADTLATISTQRALQDSQNSTSNGNTGSSQDGTDAAGKPISD